MKGIVTRGEALLVVHRRLFSDDEQRFFVGAVEAYDDGVARVRGYTWRRDPRHAGAWRKKDDPRTKLVPLCSAGLLVYPIPVDDIDQVEFVSNGAEGLVLRAGPSFEMDLSERVDT